MITLVYYTGLILFSLGVAGIGDKFSLPIYFMFLGSGMIFHALILGMKKSAEEENSNG